MNDLKAKSFGSGWHSQSVRHSNARRFGRAGGLYAPRGSLPTDVVASDKYYDREQMRYKPLTNIIEPSQAQKIINALNSKNDKDVSIRYLKQDEPVIFTQGNNIYTTPNTLLTPLGIAHEYAHTISSETSGHDKEFENNLEKITKQLPRKYGKKQKLNHKQIIEKAKNPLEQHLALAIHNEKNPLKKRELYKILAELEKADDTTKIRRWWTTYKSNIQTLGVSVPFAVLSPLMLAGVITATSMGMVDAGTGVAKIGVFGMGSYIGAYTTKGTIQNINLIRAYKKKAFNRTLKKLENEPLTPKEKVIIAHRVADELTLENSREINEVNKEIQNKMF